MQELQPIIASFLKGRHCLLCEWLASPTHTIFSSQDFQPNMASFCVWPKGRWPVVCSTCYGWCCRSNPYKGLEASQRQYIGEFMMGVSCYCVLGVQWCGKGAEGVQEGRQGGGDVDRVSNLLSLLGFLLLLNFLLQGDVTGGHVGGSKPVPLKSINTGLERAGHERARTPFNMSVF